MKNTKLVYHENAEELKIFKFFHHNRLALWPNIWMLIIAAAAVEAGIMHDGHGDTTEVYDFIIVGGGTAGCVVANRLSEKNYTLLLIEAGDIPPAGLDIPALTLKYHKETNVLKHYHSVPQKAAGLKDGGFIDYKVGRVLGGSSSVNGMMFNRGSNYDYDHWSLVTKDESWKYENLLPYFKKIEDYNGKFPSESQHGKGGPITVSQPNYAPGRQEWLQGGQQLGFPTADPYGPQRVSFAPGELDKKFGRRVSAYKGYIQPIIESRPHLKISLNSTAKRVIFEGNRAVGVSYQKEGQVHYAAVKQEIIISAGVIESPAILLKSGIGPRDILDTAGIPLVKQLTVGLNFQDHANIPLYLLLNERSEMFIPERDLNEESWEFYNKFGDGPYSFYSTPLQAFLVSSVATQPPPDFHNRNANEWSDTHFLYEQTPVSNGKITPEEVGALSNEHIVTSFVVVTRPKSAGRVILSSSDPLNGDPIVDYNFFGHFDDLVVALEGIQTTLELFERTQPYINVGARFPILPIPECRNTQFRSEDYWRCLIRQRSTTALHGGGTCRMGTGERDPGAVVDSKLRVIGIENLRVVDTSIMPNVTNANTMAAAYVIAEKAADMILHDH